MVSPKSPTELRQMFDKNLDSLKQESYKVETGSDDEEVAIIVPGKQQDRIERLKQSNEKAAKITEDIVDGIISEMYSEYSTQDSKRHILDKISKINP
mmetsp:Transcript_20293/g.17534  ORF Transcript_20293/g.17534 Transcript_20293/m.17534 type:complete len:97 (+) Transcript_20293:2576-2866(+)